MAINEETELTSEQMQARMLRYAEATKDDGPLGMASVGMGSSTGSGGGKPQDTCKVSTASHELRDKLIFVVDSPRAYKKARREVGRTAIFHLASPFEPEKLFPDTATADTFDVLTMVIDDTCKFPLVAFYRAHIPPGDASGRGDVSNYFLAFGDPGFKRSRDTDPDIVDVDWNVATTQQVEIVDGYIAQQLDNLRQMYPTRSVFDYEP